jgi:putative N6-adenine-specific DNA methylase
MDHRSTESFFAIVAPGLESICAKEMEALGLAVDETIDGGVAFSGKLRELYLANLWSRTASRVLVRLGTFKARDFPELHRRAQRLPWGRFIRPDTAISCRVSCRSSRLNHTTRIAETVESAVGRALGRTTNPAAGEAQLILVRIVDDTVTLSVDSSGELLHRRGYRGHTTAAPLRETLAAGILQRLGWTVDTPLEDPMCGSGSFPIEAALLAANRAPGLDRQFALMRWPGFRKGLWQLLCEEARRSEILISDKDNNISGADASAEAVAAARQNCRQCGMQESVRIDQRALSEQRPRHGSGLVVCNPPYGKRLNLGDDPLAGYQIIGHELRRVYPGWRIAILCPEPNLARATGLTLQRIAELDNGGIRVGLYVTRS